jgi:two-component system, cell cycle sensor histidine kinase and response regulator CckA
MIHSADILKAKILIVDDQHADVSLLEQMLLEAGYVSLASTRNPHEVCELHRKNRYDLILLDLEMPGMDGFQVMEGLKEIETGGYLPVLVITVQPDHKLRALKAGARDFVSKPFDLGEVLIRVRNMLEVRLLDQSEIIHNYTRLENSQRIAGLGDWEDDFLNHRLLWSEEIYRILGLSRKDNPPDSAAFYDRVHPDDLAFVRREKKAAAGGSCRVEFEHRIIRPGGEVRHIRQIAEMIYDNQGRPILESGTIQDITRTKQLESQLLRVQRVESVSRLASGIAHDMNNILAPIMMAVPLLRERCMSADQIEKLFVTIEASASRGAHLIKQLLFFGSGIEGQRSMLRMEDSVREIEDMIGQIFPRSITITIRVSKDAPPTWADPTQIHQVLLNLCVNARDAMPQGGQLSITVAKADVDEGFAGRSVEAEPGPYVLVTVADSGTGISAERCAKIFDPFFTTKEAGKGTGLGLSTVTAIVKGHGGFVTLKSEMGKGTKFNVYLPAMRDAPASQANGSAPPPPKGRNETVLLVDDEKSIREVVSKMLASSGYRVLTANDGMQASVLFAQHADEIKLVVTDYDMPVMDGLAMIHVLRKINPAIKVIISTGVQSGIRTSEKAAELKSLGVTTILDKPFTAANMLSAVHGLIGSGKS